MTEAVTAAPGRPPPADSSPAGVDPLTRRLFVLLIVACLAAFFVTQRLKHTPTAVQLTGMTPYFSPVPSGRVKEEAVSFKVSHAERITVQIVATGGGNVVATLVRGLPAPRYKIVSLRWDGRRGLPLRVDVSRTAKGTTRVRPEIRGPIAPAGEYRVRVQREDGRPILLPRSFTLVRG